MTMPTGTGTPEPAVNDPAAVRAEAREQVRHGAGLWLTGDRVAALGRQLVLSITRVPPVMAKRNSSMPDIDTQFRKLPLHLLEQVWSVVVLEGTNQVLVWVEVAL